MNKTELRDYLGNRFYITGDRTANYTYYDTELQQDGFGISNITGVAHFMSKELDYKTAVDLVKHINFNALAPRSLYRPNKPEIFNNKGIWFRNKWVAPVFKEMAGNRIPYPQMFIKHLELALGKEAAYYVIDVLAYRLQNPYKKKPHIAFYFYHSVGGMGKSLFLDTLRNVLGDNSVNTINTTDKLGSMSATELWDTSWLAVEEAGVGKGSKTYDVIKSFTGSDTVDADAKHVGFGKKETPAMLMLMSNRAPVFIEPDDRRFFVKEWFIKFKNDEDKAQYFKEYTEWLNGGGYEQIHFFLKNKGDIRDIEGVAPPATEEKELAMSLGSNAVVTELKDFLADNEGNWYFDSHAFTQIFCDYSINTSQRKHLLAEAGLVKDEGRKLVKGKQHRLWKRKGAYIDRGGNNDNLAFYNGASKTLSDATLLGDRY